MGEEKKKIVANSFRDYIKPLVFTKIVSNKKIIFASWGGIGYLGQFFLIISAINLFCDGDRLLRCGSSLTDPKADPSAVYDTAFVLLIIYHLIEWVRFTIWLVICFIGANLMPLWYALGLNTFYGIAAYCYAHSRRFS